MKDKIIQIVVVPGFTDGHGTVVSPEVIGLSEDGNLYSMISQAEKWSFITESPDA